MTDRETTGVYATPGALSTFSPAFLADCLSRHRRRDWGDACADDRRANDEALGADGRLFSVYRQGDLTLWIIEDPVGGPTTMMLPEDY